jgi:hypothetical protein
MKLSLLKITLAAERKGKKAQTLTRMYQTVKDAKREAERMTQSGVWIDNVLIPPARVTTVRVIEQFIGGEFNSAFDYSVVKCSACDADRAPIMDQKTGEVIWHCKHCAAKKTR